MDSMEELAAFLEVENSISTRWLATNLGVHMQKARGLMAEYKEKNSGVSASYLVTGVASSGGRSYAVVAESDLEKTRAQYSSVSCEEIYSLHKLKSTSNKIELQALELALGAEVLAMGHPHSQQFLSNALGYLSCPSMDIKPVGQRILSSSYKPDPVVAMTEAVKSSVSRVVASASVVKPVEAPVKQSKGSIKATNFFAKADKTETEKTAKTEKTEKIKPSKPAPKVEKKAKLEKAGKSNVKTTDAGGEAEVEAEADAEGETEAGQPSVPAKRSKIIMDDDDDEEWDAAYKTDANKLKARTQEEEKARAALAPKVGAVEELADVPDSLDQTASDDDEVVQDGKKISKRKQKELLTRGAMDDFMEEAQIAEYKRAQGGKTRPKKRKLVEKMFADEKGYLVTEMVWEEVTDDEMDAPVTSYAKLKEGASASVANKENGKSNTDGKEAKEGKEKKAPAKAAKKAEPKGAQKSMMSFFGKK